MSPELESTTMTPPPNPVGQALPAAPREHKEQPAAPPSRPTGGFHFQATVGRFDAAADRALFDELARWVEDFFREDLKRRPSKHVYIRKLPADVIAKIDGLRDSPVIQRAMLEQFAPNSKITPMKHTDELYISHYNKDFGGDQGLYSKHYDGNLRGRELFLTS